MAYDDEFRELIKDAMGAAFELLSASEPDSWNELRAGYGEMRPEGKYIDAGRVFVADIGMPAALFSDDRAAIEVIYRAGDVVELVDPDLV